MKKEQFDRFMNSIDDAYLEEAQEFAAAKSAGASVFFSKKWVRRTAAAAACVCLVAAGVSLFQPGSPGGSPSDGRTVTMEELQAQGFALILPEEAEAASYTMDEEGTAAQAQFQIKGETYVCTASKVEAPDQDTLEIGIYEAGNELHAAVTAEDGWIGWFSEDGQVQYLLTAENDSQDMLLSTAHEIMNTLGLSMNVAPDGAENILYYTVSVEGSAGEPLQAAGTSFQLDGLRYDYRTASTGMFEVQDLSGQKDAAYENQSQAELGWCMADLYWNEGGTGKILWLDLAPGLVYSLSVENGASEAVLLGMAETLFTPVQDDVG